MAHSGEILTLDEVVGRALVSAPALSAAAANSDLSRARIDEMRAPLYPSIFGTGDYMQAPGYDRTISNGGQTLAEAALDYTVFDGGRRLAQVRAARYAAEAATLGAVAVRAQIVFDATVAYYDLVRAEAEQREARANFDRLGGYVRIVEALQRSGRAIPNDTLRIRSARDTAELALAVAHQGTDHASIVVGSMIGDYGRTDLIAAPVTEIPPPLTGDLAESPAYKALARQIASANALVAAARAERSPTLKVGLTAGWLGINPPKTFGHHLGASYDTAVVIPLFQGGLVRSHIDEALAAMHSVQAQRDQLKLDVARDLADASDRYGSALQQIEILARSQTTADDSFALDWTRFLGGGTVTILEVIDAYQQAENLRIARFVQVFAARQAAAQSTLIIGTAR
ncbi:MAG: TolC family protein [Candidatus Binataceae bacterium]|nr:TolC family protein [Candidatus Binataceae bacterium]